MSFMKPKWFRDAPQNTRLIGYKCECGYVSFPEKRRACPTCHAIDKFERVKLANTGTVESYIVQYYLPEEFETPQPLAMVALDDPGGRLYCMMTDTAPEEMKVGMKVKLEYREILKSMEASVCSFKAIPIKRTKEESK